LKLAFPAQILFAPVRNAVFRLPLAHAHVEFRQIDALSNKPEFIADQVWKTGIHPVYADRNVEIGRAFHDSQQQRYVWIDHQAKIKFAYLIRIDKDCACVPRHINSPRFCSGVESES
jgi:hypothetical protein